MDDFEITLPMVIFDSFFRFTIDTETEKNGYVKRTTWNLIIKLGNRRKTGLGKEIKPHQIHVERVQK
jgi:hypothetical protein